MLTLLAYHLNINIVFDVHVSMPHHKMITGPNYQSVKHADNIHYFNHCCFMCAGHIKLLIIVVRVVAIQLFLFNYFNISSAAPDNGNDNAGGAQDNGDNIIVTQAMTRTTPDLDHNTNGITVYEV